MRIPTATLAFQGFRVCSRDECPVPTHRALRCDLMLSHCRQPVTRLRQSKPLTFTPLKKESQEEELASQHVWPILLDFEGSWQQALQSQNTDLALELLSTMSEQYLSSRHSGHRWVPSENRGKSKFKLVQTLTQAPSSWGIDDAAPTAKTVRCDKLLRRTEELCHKVSLRGSAVAGEMDARQLWASACKDAQHLMPQEAQDLDPANIPHEARLKAPLREARAVANTTREAAVKQRHFFWASS